MHVYIYVAPLSYSKLVYFSGYLFRTLRLFTEGLAHARTDYSTVLVSAYSRTAGYKAAYERVQIYEDKKVILLNRLRSGDIMA